MTIISAGIVSKQGKIVMSRQFTDISRIRIEGLLSAFPKLLGSNASNKQCTYIETGAVRYVYQPLEKLLLVLVTSKNSNIVEDLATLRLMGQLIPEYCQTIDEEHLATKTFEVLFAFDEVIVGGNRENNSMEQVLTYLEMQSHEEEVAKEEKKLQMELAKKEARKRAHEISAKRREGVGYGGVGSDGRSTSGRGGGNGQEDELISNAAGSGSAAPAARTFGSVVEEPTAAKQKTVGGMSLGRARKQDVSSKVLQEAGVAPSSAPTTSSAGAAAAPSASSSADGIHVKVEEKISATLNRDGGATAVDVRGDLFITISDAQLASVRLLLGRFSDDYSFKTHPNINKNMFTSDRVLVIKDQKPYPTHQTLGIVKWRLQNPGKVRAPISVTCWPGDTNATVEFELENLQATLNNVTIAIPLGSSGLAGAEPSVGNFAVSGAMLLWTIPVVDSSNSSGSLEVTLERDAGANTFFPMNISFSANLSMAGVVVAEVVSTETGVPVRFSSDVSLVAEDYVVS